MRQLTLMQGIPGSGKSTMAVLLQEAWDKRSVIVSADQYWYTQLGDDKTKYDFDPERRGDAHKWAQTSCMGFMEVNVPFIIIDNTNIQQWMADPYLALAKAYNYTPQVVRVEAPVEVCIARQALRTEDRRVPDAVIQRMFLDMERIVIS